MGLEGKNYWRSLDQLADTEEFRQWLYHEFPKGTPELAGNNNWSRRNFITLMGASFALAGLAGCRKPVEKIVPYVVRPEEVEPGVANEYATSMPLGLSAVGVVVTCREGRPIHIRGNHLHPSSRGATTPLVQASILDLYDPDRSNSVRHDGEEVTWDAFVAWWKEQYARYRVSGGEGLAVLSETFNSPSLARLKRQFEATFPKAKWLAWEPITDDNIYAGIEMATGQRLQPVHDFSKAKVVLALDCDFLGSESEALASTAGFAQARRVMNRHDEMNRLYVVESSLTVTGINADHRLRLKAAETASFVSALVQRLKTLGVDAGISPMPDAGNDRSHEEFIEALAEDLASRRGEVLFAAGRRQPAYVHYLVYAINEALGAVGTTVAHYEMPGAITSSADISAPGSPETLVILGGNPAYHSSRSPDLKVIAHTVHLSSHVDETSQLVSWHIPRAHYLESWGDTRSVDGTVSIIQPMIEPLFGGKADLELAALLVFGEERKAYDTVRETFAQVAAPGGFEAQWKRTLHDGILAGSALAPVTPSRLAGASAGAPVDGESGLELSFLVTPQYDGRFANNGWLQELPDPATKVAWDNVALFSPKTAENLKIANGNVVKLTAAGGSIEIPAWISPGQADDSIAVALGYGRTAAGRVSNGVGVNTFALRTAEAPWFVGGVTAEKTGRSREVACTQDHDLMEGRPIVRENTLDGYRQTGVFYPAEIEHPEPSSLFPEHKYDRGYQWGMSIDLNACTGCNACVIACQSENNIPVVGREQVINGREMHWLRIDRYYAGDTDDPEVAVQPMNCQHCELAPCEQVCPVAATVHDSEGLNVMVYNRCIGTRYCSNNCPYKVRRFNFFNYTKELPLTVRMQQNPEVTVRFRGVMEKCTYCTQRIQTAKAHAKVTARELSDGDVQTACQQACPAKAIVFGNINDPKSEVARLKKNDRRYRVLEELNTRPRTSYLAKLRNPNPKLSRGVPAHGDDEAHHG